MVGYWNNTLYLRCGDADAVASAIIEVLAAEKRRLVKPAPRKREQYDPMQYGRDEAFRMGVALFAGSDGWTVAKTAPLEWMCYRDRLPALCKLLGAPAFQHNVYDTSSDTLFEAAPSGETSVSGYCGSEPERFYDDGFPDESRVETRFFVPEVRDAIRALRPERKSEAAALVRAMATARAPDALGEDKALALAAVLGGANIELCDNLTSVRDLVEHLPLPAGARALYFER
jgi:hypothetical protein